MHQENEKKCFFIDIRNIDKRKAFVNSILKYDEITLKNSTSKDFNSVKEELINSIYPISIDLGKLEIDFIKNTTCAAAAIMNKSLFVTPEVALKKVKEIIEKK